MRKALNSALLIMMTLATMPAFAQETVVEQKTSFFKMFFLSDSYAGTVLIWLLILMSFITFGLTLMFIMRYRRGTLIPDEVNFQLEAMLNEKRYREAIEFADNDPSYLGALVSAALNEATNGYPAMERAVEEASDMETSRMLRPIEFLNLIGNIAPMFGLFGTVYGMIVAFHKLVEAGGRPDPSQLAGGISTALVTTLWGLVVAMPALAAYSIIRNRIDAMASEGLVMAEDLISPFKPGAAKKAAAGGAPQGAAPRPGQPAAPAAAPRPGQPTTPPPGAPRPPASPKPS